MDIYELKRKHLEKHPNSHYFDRDTLKFFGESLSTMHVLKGTVKVTDVCGENHTCYAISSLQRKYPGGPKRTHAYFDVDTIDRIIV